MIGCCPADMCVAAASKDTQEFGPGSISGCHQTSTVVQAYVQPLAAYGEKGQQIAVQCYDP